MRIIYEIEWIHSEKSNKKFIKLTVASYISGEKSVNFYIDSQDEFEVGFLLKEHECEGIHELKGKIFNLKTKMIPANGGLVLKEHIDWSHYDNPNQLESKMKFMMESSAHFTEEDKKKFLSKGSYTIDGEKTQHYNLPYHISSNDYPAPHDYSKSWMTKKGENIPYGQIEATHLSNIFSLLVAKSGDIKLQKIVEEMHRRNMFVPVPKRPDPNPPTLMEELQAKVAFIKAKEKLKVKKAIMYPPVVGHMGTTEPNVPYKGFKPPKVCEKLDKILGPSKKKSPLVETEELEFDEKALTAGQVLLKAALKLSAENGELLKKLDASLFKVDDDIPF